MSHPYRIFPYSTETEPGIAILLSTNPVGFSSLKFALTFRIHIISVCDNSCAGRGAWGAPKSQKNLPETFNSTKPQSQGAVSKSS